MSRRDSPRSVFEAPPCSGPSIRSASVSSRSVMPRSRSTPLPGKVSVRAVVRAVGRRGACDVGRGQRSVQDGCLDVLRQFVGGVRARHLAQLQQIHAQSESPRLRSSSVNPNCRLTFSAPSRIVGQNRARRIIADEGFVLPDGGLVRSVGGIDLGLLRDATANQPTPDQLHAALKRRGLADRATQQLVGWALRHGVLEEATGVRRLDLVPAIAHVPTELATTRAGLLPLPTGEMRSCPP